MPIDKQAATRASPDHPVDELARPPVAAPESAARLAELEKQNAALRATVAALAAERDRFVELYQQAPVGYLSLARDGRIATANRAAAELLGDDREVLLQRRFDRYIAPESLARWQRHFMQAWQQEEKQVCELSLRHRDGAVFLAQLDSVLTPVPDGTAGLRVALIDSARWRAEKALLESESRFRALADAAPVLLWMAGGDRGRSWVNRAWLQFTGRTMSEVLGERWTEAVHPDDLGRYLEIYRQAFDQRQEFEFEYRLRAADGHYRWLLNRGSPRYGADREFLGYLGSCVDITRLKETEHDLNQAQAVGHIGSWRLDTTTNRLSWSRENYRIFGLPEGTPLTYETFLTCVHPDDATRVDAAWQAALAGAPYDVEHRLRVNGRVKWVREKAELEFDAAGRLLGGFGITQDITELKLALRAMRDSEERFRAFMTHSPAVSWIIDAAGRYQYVSPSYYKMFRVPCDDLIGKPLGEVYPPALAETYLRGNRAVLDGGQPIESVMPGLCADGGEGEFLVIKFPIRDANNEPLVCGIALDVTEQRRASAALRTANARLEDLAAEQAAHLRRLADELTYAEQRERDRLYELLHDDIQPLLVAARLSLSSLSERTPPADRGRIVGEACEQLSQVIRVARTLSRELCPPLIRERGLATALESLCHWVTEQYGLPVELYCAPDADPEDVAIRLLVFRAIQELLLNTVKHAEASGATVHVALAGAELLEVEVADAGRGFDPTAIGGGTGLAEIARRIGMLGGELQIDSTPGRGTLATFRVPLAPGGTSEQAPAPPAPSITQGEDHAEDFDCR